MNKERYFEPDYTLMLIVGGCLAILISTILTIQFK